jgi:hypothetical protein
MVIVALSRQGRARKHAGAPLMDAWSAFRLRKVAILG